MFPAPTPNKSFFAEARPGSTFARWPVIALLVAVVGLGIAAFALRTHRETPPDEERWAPSKAPNESWVVRAAWYAVPANSRAKRRAGLQEFTAAHNLLPLGTLVRVTHLENGQSVVVCITDRGIRDRKVKLDLCREAAEQLGMISEGIARVRMEILPSEGGASPPASPTTAAHP